MKKIQYLFLLLLLPIQFYAQAASFIPLNEIKRLQNETEIYSFFKEKKPPRMLPEIDIKKTILNEIKEMNPTMGIEILSRYKLTQPISRLALYNILRSVSTLEGLTTYSLKDNKPSLFLKKAFAIDNNRNPIKDPLVNRVLPQDKVITSFDDPDLGLYRCRFDYYTKDKYLILKITNLDPINFMFFPIVDPLNATYLVVIYPDGDDLYFYGCNYINSANPFGLVDGYKDSFQERLAAINSWFIERVQSAETEYLTRRK